MCEVTSCLELLVTNFGLYVRSVLGFFKCIFTDAWAEVVLLKEDVCLTKFSVLYQKDAVAGSVIFKEMFLCLRGQLRHLVSWAIL